MSALLKVFRAQLPFQCDITCLPICFVHEQLDLSVVKQQLTVTLFSAQVCWLDSERIEQICTLHWV